jgi:signal transduction histidine kinase
MSTKFITYIAIISIVLVLLMQTILIADYFQAVRVALIKETDAILKDTFRNDLNQRNLKYKNLFEPDSVNIVSESEENSNAVVLDMNQMGVNDEGILNKFDIMMNSFISNSVPINIITLDSITAEILKTRKINSEFQIQIVNPKTEEIIKTTDGERKSSFLEITSGFYPLDFENKEALRLVLINPFSEVIKRMGLMLLGSIIFTIFSLWGISFLIGVLARQKKLVKFKNEFLSNIAHELKRPVASLVVNLDCLKMSDFFNNEKLRETMLNNSINSLTELNGTISMIVGLAKVEEGLLVLNKLPVNPVSLLDSLKTRFISSPSKKVTINTDYETTDIIIPADHLMLTQCFANLIDNSIKYSGSEVIIDIAVRLTPNYVELKFKDNGIGIPADKINNIFDKYTRVDNNTKVNGFGIGLNYVKTIIEKHNGKISVASEPGKGSVFTVTLPNK